MLKLIVLLLAVIPPKTQAIHVAGEVICTEAGNNDKEETQRRGRWVAHVLDNRVYHAVREFGEKRSRSQIVFDVLTAKHQWGHNCKRAEPWPAWLTVLARHLVEAKLHWSPPPAWLTRDVLWVIAEAESKKLGTVWGKTRCLVHTELGLAFYKKCEP